METLLKLIQQNAERTGNRCGISLVKLAKASGFTIKETFQHLSQLVEDHKIRVREGINQQLIFPYE